MTQGKTPWASAYVEPGPGRPDRFSLRDRVLSCQTEDNDTEADTATLELDNDDLALFDETAISAGNRLVLVIGYGELRSPERRYRIRKVTGGLTLRLECHGEEVLLDSEPRRHTYSNLTISETVTQVLLRAGFSAEQIVVEPTTARIPAQYQGGLTDIQFIAKLGRRLGWVYYLDIDGTYHFESRAVGEAPAQVLGFRTTKDGAHPISDFSVENDITRRPGKVKAEATDPDTKELVSEEASNATETDRDTTAPFIGTFDPENGALVVGRTAVGSVGQSADAVVGGSMSAAEAEETARGGFTAAVQHGVELSLTLDVGNVALASRTVVQVVGLGARLSGAYWVRKVSSSLSAGSFTQTLDCITEGFQRGRGGAGGGDPAALPGLWSATLATISSDPNITPELLAEIQNLTARISTPGWEQDPATVREIGDAATRLAQLATQAGASTAATALGEFASSCRSSRAQGSDETTGAVNEQDPSASDTAQGKGYPDPETGEFVVDFRP